MMPIGPLMVEHRWIERVIADLQIRLDQRRSGKDFDAPYVDQIVDFLRNYADRCHHGKEEDILFRDLRGKRLDPSLGQTMHQLTEEHKWARGTVKRLVAANVSWASGDQTRLNEVRDILKELTYFYPKHIGKEDRSFFRPVMAYLNREEQDGMLSEFTAFDASLIHEKYRSIAEALEAEVADS